jgi:hypothetical protein
MAFLHTRVVETIKVFEVNDCEWVAARDQLDAALGYAQTLGYSLERVLNDELIDRESGCPRELSLREMRHLRFHDEDDSDYGLKSYKPRSFRQQLDRLIAAGAKFPVYFATTEC